jgi:hypothetical protein
LGGGVLCGGLALAGRRGRCRSKSYKFAFFVGGEEGGAVDAGPLFSWLASGKTRSRSAGECFDLVEVGAERQGGAVTGIEGRQPGGERVGDAGGEWQDGLAPARRRRATDLNKLRCASW